MRGPWSDQDRIARLHFEAFLIERHQTTAGNYVIQLLAGEVFVQQSFLSRKYSRFREALSAVAVLIRVYQLADLRAVLGPVRTDFAVAGTHIHHYPILKVPPSYVSESRLSRAPCTAPPSALSTFSPELRVISRPRSREYRGVRTIAVPARKDLLANRSCRARTVLRDQAEVIMDGVIRGVHLPAVGRNPRRLTHKVDHQ